MVASFLTKKEEPTEIEYVDEEPEEEGEEVGDVEEDKPIHPLWDKDPRYEEVPEEKKEEENPNITINKETETIDLNTNHTSPHNEYQIPKEEIPVEIEKPIKENVETPSKEKDEIIESTTIEEPEKESHFLNI